MSAANKILVNASPRQQSQENYALLSDRQSKQWLEFNSDLREICKLLLPRTQTQEYSQGHDLATEVKLLQEALFAVWHKHSEIRNDELTPYGAALLRAQCNKSMKLIRKWQSLSDAVAVEDFQHEAYPKQTLRFRLEDILSSFKEGGSALSRTLIQLFYWLDLSVQAIVKKISKKLEEQEAKTNLLQI